MSAPHGAPVIYPHDAHLALLDPPRKHHQQLYRTAAANDDMMASPQGLHDFYRGYAHFKSADWNGTRSPRRVMPHRLNTSVVPEYRCFAELPHYYVMLKSQNMAQGVADAVPTPAEVRTLSSRWLPSRSGDSDSNEPNCHELSRILVNCRQFWLKIGVF